MEAGGGDSAVLVRSPSLSPAHTLRWGATEERVGSAGSQEAALIDAVLRDCEPLTRGVKHFGGSITILMPRTAPMGKLANDRETMMLCSLLQ